METMAVVSMSEHLSLYLQVEEYLIFSLMSLWTWGGLHQDVHCSLSLIIVLNKEQCLLMFLR